MGRIDYLFMFGTDGCDPLVHYTEMDKPGGNVTVVGVPTVAAACRVAAQVREARTAHFIELCGDFGEDGRRRVIEAVDGELPVGDVTYLLEEAVKVDKLFA